jgi:hypothetical protein
VEQDARSQKTKTLDPANRAAQRASGSFEDVEAGRLDDICALVVLLVVVLIVRIAEIVSSAVIVVIANLSCVCELSAGVAECC